MSWGARCRTSAHSGAAGGRRVASPLTLVHSSAAIRVQNSPASLVELSAGRKEPGRSWQARIRVLMSENGLIGDRVRHYWAGVKRMPSIGEARLVREQRV